MKAIKLFTLLGLLIILSCSNNDDNKLFSANGEPFIRFFLVVDSNNNVLEFPEVDGRFVAISNYEKSNLRTLKIPVVMSSSKLVKNTTATFETNITGDIGLEISPQETLNFTPEKLVDTIYVNVNSDYDITQTQKLKLKLTNVSDPSINIGIQNSLEPNNELTVDFVELDFLEYTFEENRIEVSGEQGEVVEFNVNFPFGVIPEEIDDNAIFEFLNGFDYTITRIGVNDNRTSIAYALTLNENIQNDEILYQSIITLIDTENYSATGNNILQIVKPIKIERDINANPATNFYNLADSFHRTYGEHWNDFNNDGICVWQFFFAFSYPVVVDADNPNAILYDDLGTEDTTDDIYHHAFQVGFRSTRSTTTTNSFNLKRYFTNESTSFANSPGFDVFPAIEFFPENGTSTTNGTVLIIPQFLKITGSNDNSYNIAIAGAGTYQEISPGLFEITMELKLTNDALFGGTITSEYRLYNNNSYTEPDPLTTNTCVTETDL
ncbi:hypothetical protein GCM10023311_10710 [Flaviramulus aquimarinus]|uniref:DUF1735 domain-containing protein n=1 Tax=Flaviramulus aquimarinus TaxID=1170456 RepID=A0ABP9EYM1_9FLAO